MNRTLLLLAAGLSGLAGAACATDAVSGIETRYQSYNGVEERCIRIAPAPGGDYSKGDLKDEEALCGYDFYSLDIALCPKIWATSAAVVLYDISEGRFAGQRNAFQQKVCAGGKVAKYVAVDQLARLKFSMNQKAASNVYTPSSLLYYHLSRYFDFTTKVPAAVWREIDKDVLLNEVAIGGVVLSNDNGVLRQNNAAWRVLVETIENPESYVRPGSFGSAADLITADGRKAYGALYDGGGDPYGPELNGISNDEQPMTERYLAFDKTPVNIALFTKAPLREAIATGLNEGAAALEAEGALGPDITDHQMAFWMREMSEILLIDHMLGQQDRLGNIDYRPYFYWLEDGKAKSKRMRDQKPGEDGIPAEVEVILRSRLNDNDAAVHEFYDNHTKDSHLLERLRHFDAGIYRRLIALSADFRAAGPAHEWLSGSFGLEPAQIEMIKANTILAAGILQTACMNGDLLFDLNPKRFFETGEDTADTVDCSGQ